MPRKRRRSAVIQASNIVNDEAAGDGFWRELGRVVRLPLSPRSRLAWAWAELGATRKVTDRGWLPHARQIGITGRVDLGAEHQMVLELRPSHDPEATWGFAGVVVSTADLSASVWRWHREGTEWLVDKVITIPAEPADAADLPPALQPFGAVPPLISDIDLSVDDRMLYVSCWGIGELKQFDVSDPAVPREVGSVHLGGIARRTAHPAEPSDRRQQCRIHPFIPHHALVDQDQLDLAEHHASVPQLDDLHNLALHSGFGRGHARWRDRDRE